MDDKLKGALIMCAVLWIMIMILVGVNITMTQNYNMCIKKYNLLQEDLILYEQEGTLSDEMIEGMIDINFGEET